MKICRYLTADDQVRIGLAKGDNALLDLSPAGIEIVTDTLKPAEDGRGEILRVYEPHGGRGRVEITAACDLRQVTETNLVEEDLAAVAVAADGKFAFELQPFQVRTFRLQRS